MHISILIPVFNRIEIVKQGLNSLYQALEYYNSHNACGFKYDVIVIDDCSKDPVVDFVNATYPSCILLKSKKHAWMNACLNIGMKYAEEVLNTDYALLWTDDIDAREDYFVILEGLLADEKYNRTIIASKVYYAGFDNKIFFSGGLFNRKTGKIDLPNSNSTDHAEKHEIQHSDWAGNWGVVIPAEVFKAINYFDEKAFPHYYGAIDFSLRAVNAGFSIICHPSLKVWNDVRLTGLKHDGSILKYFISLFSNSSNYKIATDFKFYKKYTSFTTAVKCVARKQASYLVSLLISLMKTVAYYVLELRLFLYNAFFNKIPSKFLRNNLSRCYMVLGKHSSIRSNCRILNYFGRRQIVIGRNCIVNPNCLFDGRKGKIIIGNNVSISSDVIIYTLQHKVDCDYFMTEYGNVEIGDNVWIGARSVILAGVKIGRGAVIASNSVVTKDIPPMTMVGGIPAKPIRTRKSRLRYNLVDKHFFQ